MQGRFSLTITLAVSISLLVLIAVLSVLSIGIWSGARNTMSLLRDKAQFVVSTMVDKVTTHLEPARNQLIYVEKLISNGHVDPSDPEQLKATLAGSLAAAPQISAVLYVQADLKTLIVGRAPDGPRFFDRNDSGDETMMEAFTSARDSNKAVWGEPLWRDLPQETMLNLRQPVRRHGKVIGVLIAAVSVRKLSSYLKEFDGGRGGNVFVLYGRTRVLAHPGMVDLKGARSADKPLPGLAEVGDRILAAIWQEHDRYELSIIENTQLDGHVLQISDEEYIFIYRNLTGYGEQPWQVGTYLRAADVNTEIRRLRFALIVGLGMLLLAVLVAIWLARQIAWPIVTLAGAASRIGQLEISDTAALPGSVFLELNDQARAFNAMLRGLRWFETYVPKKLVRRLIRQGDADAARSEERDVTVMFTDIVGFTSLSESFPASEVAALLNEHFAQLGACIEAEEGTLDKFIGDSVMAFWGAPDEQPDHAERATRAAHAIMAAIDKDNEGRLAQGLRPIRIRIGMHSGSVTVGNIGAPDRINYTIIGDAVNVGQRLEQFAKELPEDTEHPSSVTVVASRAVIGQLPRHDGWESVGMRHLRGRGEEIEIFRLRKL